MTGKFFLPRHPARFRQHHLVNHTHIQQGHTCVAGKIHQRQLLAQGNPQLADLVPGQEEAVVFPLLYSQQAPRNGELVDQLTLVDDFGAGDEDTVKGPEVRGAASAVSYSQDQVRQTQFVEAILGHTGDGRIDLQSHYQASKFGEKRGDIARPGTNNQYLVTGIHTGMIEYFRNGVGRRYVASHLEERIAHFYETVPWQRPHSLCYTFCAGLIPVEHYARRPW